MIRFVCLIVFSLLATFAQAETLRMAVTTSFHNSGLSDVLLPQIKRDTGVDVRLVVVGTGQALKLARAGDVDAILVHSKTAEEAFIAEGFAPYRRKIMYNDFVLVGPADDPADTQYASSVEQALQQIAKAEAIFLSRGDDSGTHRKELSLWEAAGVSARDPSWYREGGSGMGATLNTGAAMDAYLLSDRASWLKFANKRNLRLLYAGDPALFNQYAFLPISPAKHSHANAVAARGVEAWLTGPKGQQAIADYRLNGEALFTPNAR
ncbi:substrate-binding domain-containing protein [Pseudahrensia aquimaris]|uniref:Substrate-binding domain-containing protein n=1 Tax=Pseudahrensia aquimaris TaxID=744461 RepID=A0ABW3FGW2_9HYPH